VSLTGPKLEKIVVVTRKTRMEELVQRYNTPEQAKFHIRSQLVNDMVQRKKVPLKEASALAGAAVAAYQNEDDAYQPAVQSIVRRLSRLDVEVHPIDRSLVPTYLFTEHDIVMTLGQDGLVANCAKYAGAQPFVGVNPDPSRFDGALLPFQVEEAVAAVENVLRGRARARSDVGRGRAQRRPAPARLQRSVHRREDARVRALPDPLRGPRGEPVVERRDRLDGRGLHGLAVVDF
jgi:NAD kinase